MRKMINIGMIGHQHHPSLYVVGMGLLDSKSVILRQSMSHPQIAILLVVGSKLPTVETPQPIVKDAKVTLASLVIPKKLQPLPPTKGNQPFYADLYRQRKGPPRNMRPKTH
jgi:hypothetical protein